MFIKNSIRILNFKNSIGGFPFHLKKLMLFKFFFVVFSGLFMRTKRIHHSNFLKLKQFLSLFLK